MFKVGDKVRIKVGIVSYLSTSILGKEASVIAIRDETHIIIELLSTRGTIYNQIAHPSELELLSPILYKYVI